jgi:crotonobetainyl-CoA:carnitine CoA-transferase CaiB-like acyl-CoA transferase
MLTCTLALWQIARVTDTSLPLAGLRVIDFSRVLAGPLVTQTLGDLGADVIKIERPGHGDDTRTWGPPWVGNDAAGGEATYYQSLNRNKRSIVLDLFDDADLTLAQELARSGDVVVDNFRPGFMADRGLDRTTLAADNPAVVTCTITAFGESGPASTLPGYDLVAQAMGGLMHMTGEADGRANRVGVPIVDMTTGLYATIGLLAALTECATTGIGRHVTVSLFDTALASLGNHGVATTMAGADPRRDGNRHPSVAPYESYRAADGDLIIAAANNKLFAGLCAALDRPDLLEDPRFRDNPTRRAHIDELAEELERTLAGDTRDAWVEKLREHQVPTGPINSLPEALAWAEGMDIDPTVVDGDGRYEGIRSPITIDGTRPASATRPPRLDEHRDEIRRELDK